MSIKERFFRLDDFKTVRLEGTTHATPDTQQWVRYSTPQVPVCYFPSYGRIYIPENGFRLDAAGRGWVDVRSAEASEPFGLVLLFD